MKARIIDAHAHCGIQDRYPPQSFGDYLSLVSGSDIGGVVMFAPVMEIYDRYDPDFRDTPEWVERRRSANAYVLGLGGEGLEVAPYFFIWNDFAVEDLDPGFRGIKWHRHPDEPEYRYDDPRCAEAIRRIEEWNLPVVLEEEWENTAWFLDGPGRGLRVIIPHCGLLNGGYEAFVRAGLWDRPHVWTDTALAPGSIIVDYIRRYGHERILFGSDFPFGDPQGELRKILKLKLPAEVETAVVGGNVKRLLSQNRPPTA